MAEPEDPENPPPAGQEDTFDDDLVGFAHPRSLAGARPAPPAPQPETDLEPEPEPAPEPEPEAEPVAAEPEPTPEPAVAPAAPPEPSFFSATTPVAATVPAAHDAASREAPAEYGERGATRTFDRPTESRSSEPGVTAEGDGRVAFAIYVCLIGAALTAGLTVVLALAIVWTARFLVQGWTRSHLLYQLRTSFVGTIAGVVGVATIPLGVGVFVLSLTVIWVVARGAAGLYRLVRRQPIRDPQTWSLP